MREKLLTDNKQLDRWKHETEAALCLNLVPGIGPRLFAELVETFGSPSGVLEAAPAKLREIPGVGSTLVNAIVSAKDSANVQEQMEICRQHEIQLLEQGHDDYPAPLAEIYDPPAILFCQGKLLSADNIAVAIVGSRHATRYGLKVAENLARGLSMTGVTIVSGMARGIKCRTPRRAAGRWANAGGPGGGLLKLYPPEHTELAKEIRNQGALLTEALPYSRPQKRFVSEAQPYYHRA